MQGSGLDASQARLNGAPVRQSCSIFWHGFSIFWHACFTANIIGPTWSKARPPAVRSGSKRTVQLTSETQPKRHGAGAGAGAGSISMKAAEPKRGAQSKLGISRTTAASLWRGCGLVVKQHRQQQPLHKQMPAYLTCSIRHHRPASTKEKAPGERWVRDAGSANWCLHKDETRQGDRGVATVATH
jgi:hypothetical protein